MDCLGFLNYNRDSKDLPLKEDFQVEEKKIDVDLKNNVKMENFTLNYVRGFAQSDEDP